MESGCGISSDGHAGLNGLPGAGFGFIGRWSVAVLVEAKAVVVAPYGPLATAAADGAAGGGVTVCAFNVCV